MQIDKSTMSDKRRMLCDALGNDGWVLDFDETYVYFEQWDNVDERYVAFRKGYEISEGNVISFSGEKDQVIATTEFKVVQEEETEKNLLNKLLKTLNKHFGGSKRKDVNVIKQFGEDGSMTCIEPLYSAPLQVDGDGEMMSADTIEGMVSSINKANSEGRLQYGLFHKHLTDSWYLDKAWVNPTECIIGETVVPEGQPIAKTVFTNESAFELRKSGDIAGLSIGARAKAIVDLDKSAEELLLHKVPVSPKREIVGTHFDWDYPELTYTSKAQGGAAHMQNQILNVAKAKRATKQDLLPEEVDILKEINEEFVSLEKHLGEDNKETPSSSAEAKVGEETTVDKGNKKTMSENTVTREEFESLQKALKVSKAENALMRYKFDDELNKQLAEEVSELDNVETITKAFDALIARGEEALDKAKKEGTGEDNELQKALSEEQGESGEPEQEEVSKSLVDKIMAHQDNKGAK